MCSDGESLTVTVSQAGLQSELTVILLSPSQRERKGRGGGGLSPSQRERNGRGGGGGITSMLRRSAANEAAASCRLPPVFRHIRHIAL